PLVTREHRPVHEVAAAVFLSSAGPSPATSRVGSENRESSAHGLRLVMQADPVGKIDASPELPETAAVRPGEELDRATLESWLRPRLADILEGTDEPLDILQFPNGSANLTYLIHLGSHELVLRRPPMGQLAPGAHDMRREYKVLSHLWRRFDRAPRAYVFC